MHAAVWPQYTWAENWGLCPSFFGGVDLHLTHVARAQAYLHAMFLLGPCSRLATIDMGHKLGNYASFWGGGLGPHLTQCRLGRGLPSYQVAS